jgi:[ribosomal protein S5]-alanine N-acetyltransferase
MRKFIMQTERIGFSVWGHDDLGLALGLWSDPKVTMYISNKGPFSPAEIETKLRLEIFHWENFRMQYWPIFLRNSGEFIGCCGLRPRVGHSHTPEMGVHLRPEFWRRGLAREACQKVIDVAFEDKEIKAIFAGHNPNNSASARLLKDLGFKHTHDEFYPPTGLMHPSYLLTRKGNQNLVDS